MHASEDRIRDVIEELLCSRALSATICPSEVARAIDPQRWRPLMPEVRAAAIALAKSGAVEIRQGGLTLDPDQPLRGPIRLGRALAGAGSSDTS
ncbi:DUF3253 domain-containing protein [Ramlibacter sp.]|uniref:DUF3253 domain-containing protein n=1 Tax=Ramlibacter sp. TaxID=1917967 RepID=UPI003D138BD0